MHKILVSFPDNLFMRMKALIPERKRSEVIAELVEKEISKREKELYHCAMELENDRELNDELRDWDSAAGDGIEPETW